MYCTISRLDDKITSDETLLLGLWTSDFLARYRNYRHCKCDQERGQLSHVLQVVKVRVYNMQECIDAYPDLFKESNMISVGARSNGPRQGDSGGPMVYGGKLCGIISWGKGWAQEGLPDVYTNVAKIIDFINENIKKPSQP